MHVQLNGHNDVFIWNLHQHGQYKVHSLYMNKQLWLLRVPLKIKFFMWYMHKEVILIKDNLARRN
jgi:hypothetical protein